MTASQGDNGVTLSWLSAHGAAFYEIWRNSIDESTSATRIVDRIGVTMSFFDRAPESGATNYYWVKAVSPAGASPFSESVRGISRPIRPGDKKWEFDLGVRILCDPVVGANGTIYLSAGDFLNRDALYIVAPDGTLTGTASHSVFSSYPIFGSLTMNEEGTIYGVQYPPELIPLSEFPRLLTMYEITGQGTQAKTSTTAPPAIGVDGSLNFASFYSNRYSIFLISQNGSNRWQLNTEGKLMRSKPAIGPDNTIYVGTRTNVFAINPDGTQKWVYTDNLNLESAPAIGKDGEIYLSVDYLDDQPSVTFTPPNRFLLALNPDGTKKWMFGDGGDFFSSPAIAADGTIYIGSVSNFYALNPDGGVKWTFTAEAGYCNSPALSSDGVIYFTSGTNLYALDSTGSTRWVFTNPKGVGSAPFLADDGTIYSYAGSTLVAVKGTTGNLIHPWPMQAHDARHTARASRLPATTNNPSTISSIPNQFACGGKTSFRIEFTVGDVETLSDSLNIQATSSNQWLVPDGNISLRGMGTNRTMIVFPAPGQQGQTLITVTVIDGDGASSSTTFLVILGGCVNPVENDFNTDGSPDVVFQHQDGSVGVWFMNNGPDLFSASFFNPTQVNDAHWRIVATQDFNRDGRPDLLFQHEDGTLAVWYMNGIDLVSAALLNPSQPGEGWRVAATGDFDRDGQKDILFQHTDGTLAVWLMDGTNLIQGALLNPSSPGDSRWRVVGTADLTLTGTTDLIFQHTDGTLAAWYMDGTNLVRAALLNPAAPAEEGWQVAGTLDLNKDGKTDLLFQYDDGTLAVWLMDGINLISGQLLNPANPGPGWRIVGPR